MPKKAVCRATLVVYLVTRTDKSSDLTRRELKASIREISTMAYQKVKSYEGLEAKIDVAYLTCQQEEEK